MQKPLCVILMGSSSDSEHASLIADELKKFGIDFVVRVGSAHKTPAHVLNLLAEYEAMNRPKVYITIAGRSNALSGFVDGVVLSPVIACPPKSDAFGGADIFSSLRMPSGISVATICEPKNAALFVAKIFAQDNSEIKTQLKNYVSEKAEKIIRDDANLQK
ncbi:MAG: 5-(carboxyamino)imidazole ribonucleotide mutase [Treponemataceae bacterium]